MSINSEQERERLKEEFKEHYRKMREAKEKLQRSKYVKNVSEAMQQMNADELLSSVDEFLGKVRSKMVHFESRLDVAMEQFLDNEARDEADEELRKERARDTLKHIKMEMGLLYTEIEQQAKELNVNKTVGKKDTAEEDQTSGQTEDKSK